MGFIFSVSAIIATLWIVYYIAKSKIGEKWGRFIQKMLSIATMLVTVFCGVASYTWIDTDRHLLEKTNEVVYTVGALDSVKKVSGYRTSTSYYGTFNFKIGEQGYRYTLRVPKYYTENFYIIQLNRNNENKAKVISIPLNKIAEGTIFIRGAGFIGRQQLFDFFPVKDSTIVGDWEMGKQIASSELNGKPMDKIIPIPYDGWSTNPLPLITGERIHAESYSSQLMEVIIMLIIGTIGAVITIIAFKRGVM